MTTKEEILEKKFNNNSIRRVTYIPDIKGILEAMEEFAQQNLREELIKFCAFKVPSLPGGKIELEKYVDEYLKQR